MQKKKITVLIVDDSPVIRHLFTSMLENEDDIEVLGTAEDPYDAREKIKTLNPDVITLDIEMPKMDGISFLEKIMTLRPTPVVMVSTLTQKGASETLRALELGAIDYISKPQEGDLQGNYEKLKRQLVEKIFIASQVNLSVRALSAQASRSKASLVYTAPPLPLQLIGIGSSTGGVEALRDIFKDLPGNLPPIVMVQHMPAQFTPSLAARLNGLSAVTVNEVKDGDVLKSGYAYLAAGGKQFKIVKKAGQFTASSKDGENVSGHKPSVDVIFESLSQCAPRSLAVILTGMGKDGAVGMKKMHDVGAHTIGQDQTSCVVYGMPRAAMECGAVSMQAPLKDIAEHIVRICNRGGSA